MAISSPGLSRPLRQMVWWKVGVGVKAGTGNVFLLYLQVFAVYLHQYALTEYVKNLL